MVDNWHVFLNWMADHGILFSAIINLLITISAFAKVSDAILRKIIVLVIVLTVLISLEYYPIQISYWPFNMLPVMGIIVTFFVSRSKNEKLLKRYTLILYIFFQLHLYME